MVLRAVSDVWENEVLTAERDGRPQGDVVFRRPTRWGAGALQARTRWRGHESIFTIRRPPSLMGDDSVGGSGILVLPDGRWSHTVC